MSDFLQDCMRFIDTEPYEIIRISQIHKDGEIETFDRQKTNFCQNIYSGAKAFAPSMIVMVIGGHGRPSTMMAGEPWYCST